MSQVDVVATASGGTWKLYEDGNGVPVVKIEIDSAARSPQEDSMLRAELLKLMRAACEGRLKPNLDIKHIQRNPWIFELRWNLGGDGVFPLRLWRLYFGWHKDRGPLRLGLKFGEKPAGKHGAAVQDAHIDEAWTRYRSWLDRTVTR